MKKTTSQELLILYGSQTGVAEEISERIAREALNYDLRPSLLSMDQYDLTTHHGLPKESRPTVFVCSTTGQGDEPANMKVFWKYLCRRSHEPDKYLANLRFAVFGLGDSSYIKFNFVAKKLQKRLVQLGGIPLVEIGLGDDQHDLGPDGHLDPWLIKFWNSLSLLLNVSSAISSSNSPKPTPKFLLVSKKPDSLTPSINPKVHLCPLLKNERVTAQDHFQDVRLFSIDTEAYPDLIYSPGDVIVIQPSNLAENVTMFYELFPNLKADREKEFYLAPHPDRPWACIPVEMTEIHPFPWTLDYMVHHYFDLQRTPKRYFFELLAHFTTSELEGEKLLEFSRADGQEDLFNYSNRPKRTTLEVLQDFPYATPNIPIEFLFDLFGPIRPRSFSISSSMSMGSVIQILVAVVNYKTKLKKPRLGLCSNWLARLSPGSPIPVWIEKGSFKFPPPEEDVPVIMVGPGTGVAPFRSFITQRVSVGNSTELTLFFGCRFQGKDFYFREEWESLVEEKRLHFFPAFSRDNLDANKVYVQHKIEEESSLVWDLIERKGGYIFIAGNAKRMPIDVSEAFIKVFQENDCPHPENYMKHLVKSGRYQTEVWS